MVRRDVWNGRRVRGLWWQVGAGARLVVGSHQKRTVEAAACLYGVSMAPGGSSRVVSERVEAERVAQRLGILANG